MDKEPSVICQLAPKYQPQPECSGHSSSRLSTCLGGLPLPRVLYGTSPHWCPCHSYWVNSCFLCRSDSPHLSLCPAHLWQPSAPKPGRHFLAIQIKLKCHISVQCCLTSSRVFLDSHPISCSSSHYRFGILLFGSLFLICFLIRMKAPGRRGPPFLSSLFYWKAWNRSFNTTELLMNDSWLLSPHYAWSMPGGEDAMDFCAGWIGGCPLGAIQLPLLEPSTWPVK